MTVENKATSWSWRSSGPSSPVSSSNENWTISKNRKKRSELANHLDSSTCYAFAELVAIVLRMDFLEYSNEAAALQNLEFSETVIELVTNELKLPEKTCRSLQLRLTGEGCTDDIVSLVGLIKRDAFLKENGSVILLADVVSLCVETGKYDSRYRVLMRHVSALLAVRWDDVEEKVEETLAHLLVDQNYEESEDSRDSRIRKERVKKIKRYLMVGAAGGVGGLLIGVTGGLAAPLVATGAGVVLGAAAATGIASTVGATLLASLFGLAGAGLAGYKMKKRVGAIEEFAVDVLSEGGNSLHVVLAVSGWVEDSKEEDAFKWQWRHLNMSKEQYTLRYEGHYLVELGKAMDYLMSFAVSYAIQQTLMETALAGLVAAVAWPVALLSVASVLDNPWNVCIRRSREVGEHLAHLLLSRKHGQRPVTLIGFSLGARVIYHCLLEMSRSNSAQPYGLIEDVVLLGTPVSASTNEWKEMCKVVAGRVINGYCTTDWLLRFLYRTMSVQFTIAGTGPVDNKRERKIVNFNLTHIVSGHMDYSKKLTEVLSAVGISVTPHSDHSCIDLASEAVEEPQLNSLIVTERTKAAQDALGNSLNHFSSYKL